MRPAVLVLLLLAGCASAAPAPVDGGWIALFNGRDLDGWTPKVRGFPLGDNHLDTFRVEDGLLKVRYDKYAKFDEKFGHLFYRQPCSNYRLRVEYRFVGEQCPGGPAWAFRNSGAMLHGQDPRTMDLDQSFPVSIEVQFLGGNGKDPRSTANLCTPGTNVVIKGELVTRHCTNSASKTFHGDGWVVVEVEVRAGKGFRHFVNGEFVMEYNAPQLDPRDADARKLIRDGKLLLEGGTISLQAESHPVDFRRVELLPLD